MKKFIAYMLLAGLVYVFIYFLLINDLREEAAALSQFCETLKAGQTVANIRQQAAQAGFQVAISELEPETRQLMFISDAPHSDASCRVLLDFGQMQQKHFSLMLF